MFSALDAITTSNPTRFALVTYVGVGASVQSTDPDSNNAVEMTLYYIENPSDPRANVTKVHQHTVKSIIVDINSAADGSNEVPLTQPDLAAYITQFENFQTAPETGASVTVVRAVVN